MAPRSRQLPPNPPKRLNPSRVIAKLNQELQQLQLELDNAMRANTEAKVHIALLEALTAVGNAMRAAGVLGRGKGAAQDPAGWEEAVDAAVARLAAAVQQQQLPPEPAAAPPPRAAAGGGGGAPAGLGAEELAPPGGAGLLGDRDGGHSGSDASGDAAGAAAAGPDKPAWAAACGGGGGGGGGPSAVPAPASATSSGSGQSAGTAAAAGGSACGASPEGGSTPGGGAALGLESSDDGGTLGAVGCSTSVFLQTILAARELEVTKAEFVAFYNTTVHDALREISTRNVAFVLKYLWYFSLFNEDLSTGAPAAAPPATWGRAVAGLRLSPKQEFLLGVVSAWWQGHECVLQKKRERLAALALGSPDDVVLQAEALQETQRLLDMYKSHLLPVMVLLNTAILRPEQMAEFYVQTWPYMPVLTSIFTAVQEHIDAKRSAA
ncbi:MAG: hypothetical protein J3K34DRAFT_456459 [Monoraphidium minutum]|nr:MAG: hypothetical protein J3K34DRAFT_456459 [Monoraphidium minutum]